MSIDIQAMQTDLVAAHVDGWLFYDFRGRDPIAQRILKLPAAMRTRRWFYFVPAKGTPRKLVHKIEAQALESLPGETFYYAGLKELKKACPRFWAALKTSPCNIPPKTPSPTSPWWMPARSRRCVAQAPKLSAPPTWCRSTKPAGPTSSFALTKRQAGPSTSSCAAPSNTPQSVFANTPLSPSSN